ncbi:MAG: exonuclease [Acidobacteria bacterium]|nr:exonuclease [Acidobacteriota bacterium]
MSEVYVSTDVETDGPIPGPHSMLSFASAAFQPDGTLIRTFSANLETLPGAAGHPDTMSWWQTQPKAWAAARENLQTPGRAMRDYVAWLKALPGQPVFVGYPVVFDYMFVHWYLHRFAGESPFSFVALDVKTFAMAVLKLDFLKVTKATMPAHWFDAALPHTHLALDDAIEQGATFCKMLAEHLNK